MSNLYGYDLSKNTFIHVLCSADIVCVMSAPYIALQWSLLCNRILRRQMRNLELLEVQIKSASCGDKKKKRKKKRGIKFDKVSLALVGKSQCFSTKQAHLPGGACNVEGTFYCTPPRSVNTESPSDAFAGKLHNLVRNVCRNKVLLQCLKMPIEKNKDELLLNAFIP